VMDSSGKELKQRMIDESLREHFEMANNREFQDLSKYPQKPSLTIHSYDFSSHIKELVDKFTPMLGSKKFFVCGKRKSNACRRKQLSKRRSQFTGVTRNSINYQTLVVIDGKKTYVGSFPEEKHAAITFDFYSMLLRERKATTNFSYTADEINAMMGHFLQNDGVFDPSAFSYKFVQLD
jgi:hypothetical protein